MLGETLSGIKVVKSFAAESQEERRFVNTLTGNYFYELDYTMLSYRVGLTLNAFTDLTYAGVLLFAGWAAVGGRMTIGEVVAFLSYLTMLFGPIGSISGLMQISVNARSGFERVLTLLDTRPKIVHVPNPVRLENIRGQVAFERVSFKYRGFADSPGHQFQRRRGRDRRAGWRQRQRQVHADEFADAVLRGEQRPDF